MNQLDEQLLFHDIGIHKNVAVLSISMVLVNREKSLLPVQIQGKAVQEIFLGGIHGMI